MLKCAIASYYLGAGIGGLICGQLLDSGGWSYPFLFNVTGVCSIFFGLFFAINYHTWGKHSEKKAMERFEKFKQEKEDDVRMSELEGYQVYGLQHM